MMTIGGLSTSSCGVNTSYSSNPFGTQNDEDMRKKAHMNFFQGFNQGTGSQSDASAIRACGNSLDIEA